ncbi:ABC transporter ATP-binding protein [Clostridium sp. LY3-2]|uniref:ABC transporter ATP-binding protein n=1 Tax=Clostridium sp. LY3-2 TaxID=2942482 RepID=UPI002152F039|nr:ABC transporter ATP-binding protein [Clostridium sp. LY3-2]MCR6514277.1 ABC transporter ATP-binding protein [Clostridium sp. LY3-2]
MNLLSVSNVTKSFKNSKVLDSINVNVSDSEIVGILGPSGAGKTTLIKCIMGMEKVDSGDITLLDSKIPNREVLNKVGYMAQSDALYTELTAKDNLYFFGEIFKIPKKELKEKIDFLVDLVDLKPFLNRKVNKFSGGMKRRLSLIIALIQDPEIIILDEPTVGIYPELRLNIWKEINNLKSKGKSIIVTTHDMTEAIKCDRLLLLKDGNITASGTPEELMKKFNVDSIEEVFLIAGRKK